MKAVNQQNSDVEGLCQSCSEWVVPEDEFCPICGNEFIDMHDRDFELMEIKLLQMEV